MDKYPNSVRRKDRQQTDISFLEKLLAEVPACSIAVETGGQPMLHTSFFVYDAEAHAIVFHFSKHGYGAKVFTAGKKATVSVFRSGNLYTAKRAVDFGGEYESVVMFGEIEIIQDPARRNSAMALFFNRYFSSVPADTYETFTERDMHPIEVFCIRIREWTGKAHLAPATAQAVFAPSF